MPTNNDELVEWNCECGVKGCSAIMMLPQDVINKLFDTKGLFVVSISCKADPQENDEFIKQGDGYLLYKETRREG